MGAVADLVRQSLDERESVEKFYHPEEARGEHGRWTGHGGRVSSAVHGLSGRHDATAAYEGGRDRNAGKQLTDVASYLRPSGQRIMGGFGSTEQKYGALRGKPFRRERVDAVHGPYLNAELSGRKSHESPTALFTSGGAASGKSWLKDNRAPDDSVIIDADRAKTGEGTNGYDGIPEYNDLKATGHSKVAASAVHEESSRMSKELTTRATQARHNIVVDSVGNSGPGKFAGKVRQAVDAGYAVNVEHMHLPVEDAIGREARRSERTGRKVNEGALRQGHAASAASMLEVARIPGVHVKIWSSNVPQSAEPKLVAEGMGSEAGVDGLDILDPQEFADFKRKAGA